MGLNVLHDRELYDYPSYNDGLLTKGPGGDRGPFGPVSNQSDGCWNVHRGTPWWAPAARCIMPVLQIDGVKTAQVMLLVGHR